MTSPWKAGKQAERERFEEMYAVGNEILDLLKKGAENRDREGSILFTTGTLGCVVLALDPAIRLFLLEELMKFIQADTKPKKRKR
jgi:hypothetical protein